MISVFKNILVVIALLLTLAFGYFLYLQNNNATLNIDNQDISINASAEAAQFLQRLTELKAITLDNTIFLDPRLSALNSYAGEVQAEPIGKSNPFLGN